MLTAKLTVEIDVPDWVIVESLGPDNGSDEYTVASHAVALNYIENDTVTAIEQSDSLEVTEVEIS